MNKKFLFLLIAVFFACSNGGDGEDLDDTPQGGKNSSSSVDDGGKDPSSSSGGSSSSEPDGDINPPPGGTGGPVSYYGALKVCGNNICGETTGQSKPVQLKGVSLGWSNPRINGAPRWINWTASPFFEAADKTVSAMFNVWKAEVIRAPLGVDPAACGADEPDLSDAKNGYPENPNGNKNNVIAIVDAAISQDMYVIIDFHTHRGNNYVTEAETFFEEMAERYGNDPHIIWEIWNEPCTNHTPAQIASYANTIIPIIRAKSSNLIIVGSPWWSQRPNEVNVSGTNIAYTFHFYAENHNLNDLLPNIDAARTAGKAVFVTEFGTMNSGGGCCHSDSKANNWLSALDTRKISYVAWQINSFNEESAFFKSSFNPATASESAWGDKNNMNSDAGKYIFDRLTNTATTSKQPWRGGGDPGDALCESGNCSDAASVGKYCDYGPRSGRANCSEVYGGCEQITNSDRCDLNSGRVVATKAECITSGVYGDFCAYTDAIAGNSCWKITDSDEWDSCDLYGRFVSNCENTLIMCN